MRHVPDSREAPGCPEWERLYSLFVSAFSTVIAIQIEQATGVHPMHPIEVLARAYKRGGFPDAVSPSEPRQGE